MGVKMKSAAATKRQMMDDNKCHKNVSPQKVNAQTKVLITKKYLNKRGTNFVYLALNIHITMTNVIVSRNIRQLTVWLPNM
jgi:hypothetical protein